MSVFLVVDIILLCYFPQAVRFTGSSVERGGQEPRNKLLQLQPKETVVSQWRRRSLHVHIGSQLPI